MQTFTVDFSDSRFGPRPQGYWNLVGRGEARIDDERLLLRGARRRPFMSPVSTEISIPLTDISNVIREGSRVQCHVRAPGGMKVLQLWSTGESEARQLLEALPKERTEAFEKEVAEHNSFVTALAGLRGRPAVTLTLVSLNCAIFVFTLLAGADLYGSNSPVLIKWGTNYGPLTLSGEWWRLLTSMFLHFGVLHIAFNMWALWDIGQLTERLFGSAYFLVLYLFAGLTGSLASLYWHPGVNSAGASGAIFGVIGGLLAFMVNPKTRIPANIATAHRNSAGIFILFNLANGFALAGIDNAAHIGGLVGGFAMGWVLARPVNIEARRNPLPRLAIGTLVGAAVVLALVWRLASGGSH